MAKAIMVQGTMSNAGKSLLCAGLCRVFRQDGYRVAPFKSQNMALNSFITREGLEMGRAQAVQAEACKLEPDVRMNPVLLKPTTNVGSQVIVNGEVRTNMNAAEYFSIKKSLVHEIRRAYETLAAENDIMVIEGAGSPAEINLKQDDIVNMGMARLAKAPVLLVGDIDRGGVFAQLYGTVALLSEAERAMIKAIVVNKFRGDIELLRSGLSMLEELTGKPVAGVLPYLDVDIDDEDSLSERFGVRRANANIDIAVIQLPCISNFTDFTALAATKDVCVRYVSLEKDIGAPSLIILPGTKNTISDLRWLRQTGLEAAVKRLAFVGTPIIGICGGYQMLGERITDAEGVEGGGSIPGMGLLPVTTEFTTEKRRTRVTARALMTGGAFARLADVQIEGYEIHMGVTTLLPGASPLLSLSTGEPDGCACGSVYGTYLHGFFDTADCRAALLSALSGKAEEAFDYEAYRQAQYDKLASAVRSHLDMEFIYRILEEGV